MSHLMTKNSSLTARIITFSCLGIVVLMLVSGSAIIWAFNQSIERSVNNYLSAYLDVLTAATSLGNNGRVVLRSNIQVLEDLPRYWQITSGNKHIRKSPLLQNWVALDDSLEPGIAHRLNITDKDGTTITAVYKILVFPGNQKVSYMFGVQADIADAFAKQERTEFLHVLLLVLLLLSALLLLFAYLQIRLTVNPLKRIRQALGEIRSGKTSQLGNDFPKEIQLLADEVNRLIAYSSGMVERYRSFASNLAHALKTPLSVLRNEAYKEATPLAQTVKEKGDIMLAIVDRNLARVKAAGTANLLNARTDAHQVAAKIARSFGKLYGREVKLAGDDTAWFRGEEGDLYEILGNVIENACKYAKFRIEVTILTGENIIIRVADDGPGIPETEREKVLKRGIRLDETVPGTGIGLSITRELVELYGGNITLNDALLGGLEVTLTLPAVSSS